MSDNNSKVEQRLHNMKKAYYNVGKMIGNLPEIIPVNVRTLLEEKILGDKDLKDLIDGIDLHRPPRLFLIGRTGVGKSSLINAICSSYVAPVSNIKSGTEKAQTYQCKDKDRILMEIFDTRGIAESEVLDNKISAEDLLIDEINKFSPDIAIFMLNCTHRDDIITDINFLKKVCNNYAEVNKLRLPVVVVINKCDEVAPSREKNPKGYSANKLSNINQVTQFYKGLIINNGLKIDDIIAVSSLIDWQTPDGIEVDASNIENLPQNDIDNLEILFDGRFKVQELISVLEVAIQDFEAQMGLRMAARLNDVVERFSNHLIKIFSGIAATVALSPIPMSDFYILILIQSFLVSLIASLSGRDITLETAKEFIIGLGGVAGAGYAFKVIAQQSTKLFNVLLPGTGSVISSSIAMMGTRAIGKSAIAYFINDLSIEEVRKVFNHSKKEFSNEPAI